MATANLTWVGVTARRMARQALIEPATDLTPAAVAGLLCGVHAQMLGAAELSIARRIVGASCSDVRRALWEERILVKTFGPRGTIHLLAAPDLPMWTSALSALPPPAPRHPVGVRFSAEQSEEVLAAIGDALGGAELTIDELTDAIAKRLGPWAVERTMEAFQGQWPRWRQLTSTAAHRGLLCFGPNRARNVTYTNPQRWLTDFPLTDSVSALRTLLTRYLYAYGPANPQHYARWLSITPRAAVEQFEALADDLECVTLEGDSAWTLAGDTATPDQPHRGLQLLPHFDQYVVVGQPRELLYPGRAATRALTPAGQAGNYPVLLIDGVVGGIWHHRRSSRKLAVTVEPLRELTLRQRRQLDDEIALLAAATDTTPSLTLGTVTIGPHA